MATLRQKFIRDLALRGHAHRTQKTYVRFIADLAKHYGRSPEAQQLPSAAAALLRCAT